ncbi:MAG: cellulose binding domain-containing protein [Anaerolineae bacterium]|nr:cellulose binding domain-containing protein [Anaerolineae bacterium]
MTSVKRRKLLVVAAIVAVAGLLTVSLLSGKYQSALAANVTMCQNDTSYPTVNVGEFTLQTNRWNEDATPSNFNLCITYDDASASGDFEVTTQTGTAATNGGPTSYPSVIAGCHWGTVCSPDNHGMPMQVSAIGSIPSSWSVETPSSGKWNASYDIWFHSATTSSGQNDGAEIMIWLDTRGYSNQNENPPGTIRPSGNIQAASFTAAGYTWDVWIGRIGEGIQWNVISFVRQNAPGGGNSSLIGFNAMDFVDHAMTLDCPTGNKCVLPEWYLLSIQAGFEPWEGGVGLKSGSFVAEASLFSDPMVVTDRQTDDGRPLVNWQTPFDVEAQGCPNSTPTLVIAEKGNETNPDPLNPKSVTITDFTETPAGSGNYVFHVGELYPMHGDVTYTITFPAGCSTPVQVIEGYIDPSGKVRTTAGDPVSAAIVTLYRSDNADGPFTVVPGGSDIMSPANRSNPDTTGQDGSFGWDVLAGYYKVRAEKPGCVSPTNPDQPYVETVVYDIPPEVTNIDLRLKCDDSGGLPVSVTKFTDWGSGYCANVQVTNNTAGPVDWNVEFSLAPLGGGTIYTFWNAVYTQNGNNISNVHANPAYPWNKTLKPGESTHSVGFCANR